MDGRYYILDGHEPVKTDDMMAWNTFFGSGERVVAVSKNQYFTLSTVFLGIDHQYLSGPPILFETMVFINDAYMDVVPQSESLEDTCYRYSTWDDAVAGHESQLKVLTRQIEKGRQNAFDTVVSRTVGDIENIVSEHVEEGPKP